MATSKPKDGTATSARWVRKSSLSPTTTSVTKKPTKPTPDKPSSSTSNSSSQAKPGRSYLKAATSSLQQAPSLTRTGSLRKHQASDNEESKSPKPTLYRRRSFDKPPSPSGLPRSLMSPGRESREPPQLSRPLSVKSVSNAPKPSSRSVAGIKSQGSYTKSGTSTDLRRSTSGVGVTSGTSKTEISRSSNSITTSSSNIPRSRDIAQILNLEADFEALDHQEVGEVDKIESIEDNSEDLPDPKLAEEEVDDQNQHNASDTGPVQDAAEESKANVDAGDEEVIQVNKSLDGQVEEVDHISKDHESNEVDQGSGLASEETKAEEVIEEKKEDEIKNDGGSHVLDSKEGKEEDATGESKPEEPVVTEKPEVVAATPVIKKKEYNDVIEETASKLMSQDEKRRNKVKALAKAFETVIDYESGSRLN